MINDENAGIFRPDRRATGVPLERRSTTALQ